MNPSPSPPPDPYGPTAPRGGRVRPHSSRENSNFDSTDLAPSGEQSASGTNPASAPGSQPLLPAPDVRRPLAIISTGAVPAENAPGMGRYELGEELGRGGIGMVNAARDPLLRRDLAIKRLLRAADATDRDLFVEEAQITGQLEHPNIVPIHELGLAADGTPYLAMKRIRGRHFREVIRTADLAIRAGRGQSTATAIPGNLATATEFRRLLEIFLKVCDAMAYAHHRGVIHRDLKPENIMVGEFGDVLVVDWGLAKPLATPIAGDFAADRARIHRRITTDRRATPDTGPDAETFTVEGDVFGTPAFMAPEQARGAVAEIGPASDIYALGAILYVVLTGRPPFRGPVDAALALVADGRFLTPSQAAAGRFVPRELEAVALKAMAKNPADRYATVGDLRADIDAFLAGKTLAAADYSPWQWLGKWAARNRALVTAIGVAMLAIGVTIGVAIARLDDARRDAEAAHHRAHAHATAAEAAAQAARKSERDMRIRFADGLVAQAAGFVRDHRVAIADALLADARAAYRDLGTPTHRADWGLCDRVWRAAPPLLQLDVPGNTRAVKFSPDGQHVLVADSSGHCRVRDWLSGREMSAFRGGNGAAWWMADGRRILVAGESHVAIHDGDTGARLTGYDFHVPAIAHDFSPTANRLLTLHRDGYLSLWTLDADAREVCAVEFAENPAAIALAADGTAFATATVTGIVTLWPADPHAEHPRHEWPAHTAPVQALAFSPDGRWLASGAADGTAVCIDLAGGKIIHTLRHADDVRALAFSADGESLLAGTAANDAVLWATATGERMADWLAHARDVLAVGFSPDGHFAVTADDDRAIFVWLVGENRMAPLVAAHETAIVAADVSPDGSTAIVAESGGSGAGIVRVVDVATGLELAKMALPRPIRSFAVSPDFRFCAAALDGPEFAAVRWPLAAVGEADFAAVSDAAVWFRGHAAPIACLAWSPDGSRLATGSADRTSRLWDAESGREIRVFAGAGDAVRGVAFSPDGRAVVGASGEVPARMWDIENGHIIGQFAAAFVAPRAAIFAADGEWLLTNDWNATAHLWHTRDNRHERAFDGHRDPITALAAPRHGEWFATVSADATARIWSRESGETLLELAGHREALTALSTVPRK